VANFAVIKDGIVENYIIADSKEIAEDLTGLTCIEESRSCIGLPYIDGIIVFPSDDPEIVYPYDSESI
jgi:hypothetical protein